MMPKKLYVIISIVVGLVLVVAGGSPFLIRQLSSSVIKDRTHGDIQYDAATGSTSMNFNGDTSTTVQGELIDVWPQDLVPQSNIKIQNSSITNWSGKQRASVRYNTTDSLDSLHAYYKDQLNKNGWTNVTSDDSQDRGEKDNRTATIFYTQHQDNTIDVMVSVDL